MAIYGEADITTVEQLLTPTPERLQTAKAWLARRIAEHRVVRPEGGATEFAAEQGVGYPFSGELDTQRPESQDQVIPYWQLVQAFRYAVAEFARIGLIVPAVQGDSSSPPFDTQGPRVALGNVGQQTQPTPFPTPILWSQYQLAPISKAAQDQRLALYDADLFVARAQLGVFSERVQRCVREALLSYAADLFLAAANMLGAASEAAWFEVAEQIQQNGYASKPLVAELSSSAPGASAVVEGVAQSLRSKFPTNAPFESRFAFRRGDLDGLSETSRYWRDLRNWGMHPVGADLSAFTDASISVQLMGATTYLNKLARLRGSA